MSDKLEISISDEAGVFLARKEIKYFCETLGFSRLDREKIELITSELGMNLVKYPKRGKLLYSKVTYNEVIGIEIISEDRGETPIDVLTHINRKSPMDLRKSLKAGLTSIYNLSDEFVYEHTDKGSRFIARKWIPIPNQFFKYSVISRPKPGEWANGDSFFIKQLPQYSIFSIIDGLGHGEEAETAAGEALDVLKVYYYLPLDELILKIHSMITGTRGVVLSILKVFSFEQKLEFAGVGNVELRIFNHPDSPKFYSTNGTIGLHFDKVSILTFRYFKGATMVMFSDGLRDVEFSNDVVRLSPPQMAGFLMDSFSKSNDDATVMVIR